MICGVDEAGRGPLAGDVYAAAVILDENQPIIGLKDSKQLTESRRDRLYAEITEKSLAYAIASSSVSEIEELNILQATLLAMSRAVNALKLKPTLVLIDGNQAPNLDLPMRTIVRGDMLEPAISAASILAKVARDRTLYALDKQYPQYGFAKHKGYGTLEHRQAIKQFGILSGIHRPKFVKVSG